MLFGHIILSYFYGGLGIQFMKLNRTISALMLSAMLFSACSSDTSGTGSSSGAAPQGSSGNAKAETLRIYTWEGMFSPEILDGFTQETGIKVEFSSFDTDENMLATLQRTKAAEHDLVIADDYIIETVIKEGLAQKLDKAQIPNIGNIDEQFAKPFYDVNDEYTVPYGAGIPLIVYDPKLTGFDLKGYNDLWDARLKDSVALIGNYRVINGITLKSMGESMNTEDIAKLKEAGEKMKKLAPNVRIISDSNTQDQLVSGEVSAALLYTSQVTSALTARSDLKAVFPSEGAGFGLMAGFIPASAPNSAAAHSFLNYITKPEVAAKCFEYVGYYSTNKAANEFISDEMKKYIVIPKDGVLGDAVQNISNEANDQMMANWNEFKANK